MGPGEFSALKHLKEVWPARDAGLGTATAWGRCGAALFPKEGSRARKERMRGRGEVSSPSDLNPSCLALHREEVFPSRDRNGRRDVRLACADGSSG